MGKPDKNTPCAASALIIHTSGLVLAVSRKYDPSDLGLPGGKLDPGESAEDAVFRETFEETGLRVVQATPIFADYCGNAKKHKVHWCTTFLCKAEGMVSTQEKGRVVWVHPMRLVYNKSGGLQSFGEYNFDVQRTLLKSEMDVTPYMSDVPLHEVED